MIGGWLSHQWRLFQISRLTLTRSKSRIINFTNSVLIADNISFTYHLFRYHRMLRLHFTKQLFSSIAKPGAKCHCSWSKLDKIPTHCTSTVTKPKQMSAFTPSPHVWFVWRQIKSNQVRWKLSQILISHAMEIVTDFKTTRNENCNRFKNHMRR